MSPEKLTATVEGWDIKINAADLIASLSDAEQAVIGQAAACQKHVVKAVVDLLILGSTDDGSYPTDSVVNAARKRVLESLDAVRSAALKHFALELDEAQRKLGEEWRENSMLRGKWHEMHGYEIAPPRSPETDWDAWRARRRTVEQIAEEMAKAYAADPERAALPNRFDIHIGLGMVACGQATSPDGVPRVFLAEVREKGDVGKDCPLGNHSGRDVHLVIHSETGARVLIEEINTALTKLAEARK